MLCALVKTDLIRRCMGTGYGSNAIPTIHMSPCSADVFLPLLQPSPSHSLTACPVQWVPQGGHPPPVNEGSGGITLKRAAWHGQCMEDSLRGHHCQHYREHQRQSAESETIQCNVLCTNNSYTFGYEQVVTGKKADLCAPTFIQNALLGVCGQRTCILCGVLQPRMHSLHYNSQYWLHNTQHSGDWECSVDSWEGQHSSHVGSRDWSRENCTGLS